MAPKKAVWTSSDDATLVQNLVEQQAAGNQADNNWKSVVWNACIQALAGSEDRSGGLPKTANGCKDHRGTVSFSVICINIFISIFF